MVGWLIGWMVAGKVALVSGLAVSGGGEAGRYTGMRGVDEEGMTGMDEGVGSFKTQVTGLHSSGHWSALLATGSPGPAAL